MEKKQQIPRSYVQRDIIRSLSSEKELTFTHLQKILGISRKTLSFHISELKKENSIEFEKRGREKYYRIGDSISKIFERQSVIFTNNYLDHLVEDPKIKDEYQRMYDSIERKLTSYFSFGIIKSIQTGQNWLESFDLNVLLYMMISPMYNKIAEEGDDSDLIDTFNSLNWNEFFKKSNALSKLTKNRKNIHNIYEKLKKKYPDEVKELEKLSKC